MSPVDPAKIDQGRVSLHRALMKVKKHYGLNPMELVYAHHEALKDIGDYSDRLWLQFVAESFKEVMLRDESKVLVSH